MYFFHNSEILNVRTDARFLKLNESFSRHAAEEGFTQKCLHKDAHHPLCFQISCLRSNNPCSEWKKRTRQADRGSRSGTQKSLKQTGWFVCLLQNVHFLILL